MSGTNKAVTIKTSSTLKPSLPRQRWRSHRFYFITNGTLSVLTNPEFIGFWADQRRRFEKENFVVVLEDADPALMRPERLLWHRAFDRLPHKHAAQLAAHLGKTLPVLGSYSLADETPVPPPRPQRAISFAA